MGMAVPFADDPDKLRARLGDWLNARRANEEHWELGQVSVPPLAQGLSQETVLIDARPAPLVVRLAPRRFHLYPWDRFAEQCRLIDLLASRTGIAVPPVYGYELDPDVLGASFLVLGRVDGEVPPDIPPYHMQGFMLAMDEDARARVWDAGLQAMASVHQLDPEPLELDFIALPDQLEAYSQHLHFFDLDQYAADVVDKAVEWLRQHTPTVTRPPRLLWGDSRLGNLIYQGDHVAAVLDWEMATLGQPEADLAWFLHLDRHLSEGVGVQRLTGLPGPEETLGRYGQLLGRPIESFDYYRVLASFTHTVLAARVTKLIREYNDINIPIGTYSARLLEKILGEV
jgi:aminoglycoside phosphotransferase (APT) family kinase protein